ncbi:hypothetical protein HH214_07120 [Mucilaginibacter robiniae]|uniref:Uncharacterized protein n=1 Tax=Mucilaginibacter robiniae TaxID=2728022 RepID=A0A7L5DXA0_9SPHI|nr:hypothetical protein [Mucilaginibacter robiniae]QJD95655.1 hypothetical protein HH214_07120 [Mucilaginibacter robiniae]
MKRLKFALFSVLFIGLVIVNAVPAKAQCAMCTANAEAGTKNGSTVAKGLNGGIMYLLAAPYLAVAALGFVWYKKYRRKSVDMNMGNEKFHLN